LARHHNGDIRYMPWEERSEIGSAQRGHDDHRVARAFGRLAQATAKRMGDPVAFYVAFGAVVVWALSGPIFGFSSTWQLFINTSTTLLTFLMVFLIQNSVNRDSAAVQLKLDELIRVNSEARDALIGVEHEYQEDIEKLETDEEARELLRLLGMPFRQS